MIASVYYLSKGLYIHSYKKHMLQCWGRRALLTAFTGLRLPNYYVPVMINLFKKPDEMNNVLQLF